MLTSTHHKTVLLIICLHLLYYFVNLKVIFVSILFCIATYVTNKCDSILHFCCLGYCVSDWGVWTHHDPSHGTLDANGPYPETTVAFRLTSSWACSLCESQPALPMPQNTGNSWSASDQLVQYSSYIWPTPAIMLNAYPPISQVLVTRGFSRETWPFQGKPDKTNGI